MQYKYDLHVHTKEISPCGFLGVEEIIERYIAAGYAGIVLTDHFRADFFEGYAREAWKERVEDFFVSYDRACAYCKERDFFVGLGVELRFNENINDFLVYGFTKDDLRKNQWMMEQTLETFYEKFKTQALIIEAHPHREEHSYLDNLQYVHGLEIYNTNPRHENHNQLSKTVYLENPHLIGTAGSDTHRIEDLGKTGILTTEKIVTDQQLMQILKEKRFTILAE